MTQKLYFHVPKCTSNPGPIYDQKWNYMDKIKVIMQGKLFQRCADLLYCSILSLGGKANTRWMSKPDMGSIFHIKINKIFCSKETILWIIKIKCFYPTRIPNKNWCIYSCLQIPPRKNWFQYVRRVYATAIKFPCIIT